ncbi:MAG: hypothetical protein QOE70_6689 [Chthoniobacter sp.]|jgi:predicted Zn-dependent protease|nr:hypothetical protein [Chthoniobacter sp.]
MTQLDPEASSLPRQWIKRVAVVLVILVVTLGGWRGFRQWQVGRLVKEAHELVQRGDYRNAMLTLQRALHIRPTSPEVARGMAELTDKLQMPFSVDWRRSVVDLNPGSADDALAWAAASLKFRQPHSAEQALAAVPIDGRKNAGYETAVGVTALSEGNEGEAEKHFARAVELAPKNELCQYNLATIRIQSPDAKLRAEAVAVLERLAQGGPAVVFARRALINGFVHEKKLDEALRWSAELLGAEGAAFRDRLTYLDLLKELKKPELAGALAEAQQAAPKESPADVGALVNWMRFDGHPAEALQWVQRLDPKLAGHPQVAMARAECLIALGDWPGLQALVEKSKWGTLEYARWAYLARAMRGADNTSGFQAMWSQAVQSATTREQFGQLAWMATRWGWKQELRKVLAEASNHPLSDWARQMLHQLYLSEGDTNGLLNVAERAVQADPKNAAARNNVAMLSLLLKRNRDKALETARDLYQKAPENPTFASTYAFALHQAGRAPEGLAVLQKLPAATLREPSVAAYYALLLSATGAGPEAEPYFELASKAPLLPEEKALLQNVAPKK